MKTIIKFKFSRKEEQTSIFEGGEFRVSFEAYTNASIERCMIAAENILNSAELMAIMLESKASTLFKSCLLTVFKDDGLHESKLVQL